jgi:nucleotide-binding universal stress UspA family protein
MHKGEDHPCRGHPVKIILYTAKSERADLVVNGSKGMGGAKRLLLGSISNAVVNNSSIPVLLTG